MKKKRTLLDRILLLASLFLLGALLCFSFSVLDGWEKGKKECQEIVTLNPAQIDEQLFCQNHLTAYFSLSCRDRPC